MNTDTMQSELSYRQRQCGGRFKNSGSDISDLILGYIQQLFNGNISTSAINPDLTVSTSEISRLIDKSTQLSVGVYDRHLIDGGFPGYVRFDSPLHQLYIRDARLKTLKYHPMLGEDSLLNITRCSIEDLSGLDVSHLRTLDVYSCPQLKSLTGAECLKSVGCLKFDRCPALTDLSALNGCSIRGRRVGLMLTDCPNVDLTSGVLRGLLAGEYTSISICIDFELLKQLHDEGMYWEFSEVGQVSQFHIYRCEEYPWEEVKDVLSDILPWDKIPEREVFVSACQVYEKNPTGKTAWTMDVGGHEVYVLNYDNKPIMS